MNGRGYLQIMVTLFCLRWLGCDLTPPKELVEFTENGYPAIKTADENLETVRSCGYSVVDSFVLPSRSWWDNYYIPIEAKLPISQGEIQGQ